MVLSEIPLTADNQIFSIQLGEQSLILRLIYRDAAGWVMDIMDSRGENLVLGVPLVVGANLLEPYSHLGLSGGLMVVSDEDAHEYPTKTNLGYGSHLYFVQP
ncbi:hypothetical protein ACQ26G_004193 [Yersinia enterocolitica]|uniref:phage baseplate plug family protein n=1 Tax=Yersinia enterocolitica TaxID=630 RepID=UPI0005E332F2|nr:hypothetical protein [Yersinia enterocolitica]CNK98198.1 Uncharacterised protein [Yersinia enterocolitica]